MTETTPAPETGSPSPGRFDTPYQLVFGTVSTENAVTAVVRRLRAAIALGLLADGDQLPREADLARQLGVTAFALREALGVLRNDGFITTRQGKRGGSFVTVGSDRAMLTTGELRRMSATELRDLGDWRQMLASVSAALAARRASQSNLRRLAEYADALADARTELEARRAHGRFHIELAAAAQSLRMTRAEFGMYEEFDWLLGLTLEDPDRRARSAQELREIADAVAARDSDVARAAAERHSAATVNALVKLRLAAIASGDKAGRAGRGEVAGGVADELTRVLAAASESLEALAARAAEAMGARADARELLDGLSRTAMSTLLAAKPELHGIGFLAEPGTVPGHEFWIAWWQTTSDGVTADHRHVMDPDRDDFYDYPSKDLFAVPRSRGGLSAQGPYVDYGGADDYIITFSEPVLVDGEFVGVTAADLPVAAIERLVARWLATEDETCVVVNAERQVIVSNSAEHVVGDVLPLDADLTLAGLPHAGWSVATTGRSRSRRAKSARSKAA